MALPLEFLRAPVHTDLPRFPVGAAIDSLRSSESICEFGTLDSDDTVVMHYETGVRLKELLQARGKERSKGPFTNRGVRHTCIYYELGPYTVKTGDGVRGVMLTPVFPTGLPVPQPVLSGLLTIGDPDNMEGELTDVYRCMDGHFVKVNTTETNINNMRCSDITPEGLGHIMTILNAIEALPSDTVRDRDIYPVELFRTLSQVSLETDRPIRNVRKFSRVNINGKSVPVL